MLICLKCKFKKTIPMKKNFTLILFVALIFISNKNFSQTINDSCHVSLPFCTGYTFNYPAGVNSGTAEAGPDYTCLYTQPNPAWYYMQVAQSGIIDIEMHSAPGQYDIDFVCFGPFADPVTPCSANLTAANTIDCSYSSSYQEFCNIPNAQPGEYYILLITNYSNQVCNIIFSQTNTGQTGAGACSCGSVANFSGSFYHDANGNSVKDTLEAGIANAMVKVPLCGFYFMTDSIGNYNAYMCSMPDTIWPYYNHNYVISINPAYYVLNSPSTNVDFGVQIVPNVVDLSTTLTSFANAVPGFNFYSAITINNIGTTASCGNLSLTFDTIFNYVSSNPLADSIVGNVIYWSNICLNVMQYQNFGVTFISDTNAVLGNNYQLYANLTNNNDTNIVNNNDTINGIFIGSYDPNEKEVVPSGLIDNSLAAAQQEFVYTVRFQNTGTAAATTVKIVDTLSNWLQVPTFTLLSSSHPCTYSISEFGIVTFTFNNINLPDETSNEAGSHGFIKFSVKCRSQLANGGDVYNTAHIYFDYNLPIVTNTVVTSTKILTYINTIKKPEVKLLSVKPNPVSDKLNISINYNGKENLNLEIIDFYGKVVSRQSILNNQKTINLNVSNLNAGSYMVHVYGKNYNNNVQFIKN